MELKKTAAAGNMESGDIQVTIVPNPGRGVELDLTSKVKVPFGEAIEATVRQVLKENGIADACVRLQDQGALDCVIRARVQCAICRAAETAYDWTREDVKP